MNDFDQFERRLAVALRSDADLSTASFDPASIARAAIESDHTQRRGDPRRRSFSRAPRRTWMLVAAALFIGAGAIGATLVGSRLVAPKPAPSNPYAVTDASASPETSPNVTVAPSPAPSPAPGTFAYIQETGYHLGRLWVASVDGSGAHELLPDQAGNQQSPVWSPDGTRLLFSKTPIVEDGGGYIDTFQFYLTDASGTEPQLVDTGCVLPCLGDGDAAFSRDGTRLVFVRSIQVPSAASATPAMDGKLPGPGEVSVLATLDLSTGRVVELASTLSLDQLNRSPRFSPDGSQIVFTQDLPIALSEPKINGDPFPGQVQGLFVVDADGRNSHQIVPSGLPTDWPASWFPDWSPDGARIVFQVVSYFDPVPNQGRGNGYSYTPSDDIFTIRPDGTDLRQVTTDGGAFGPSWTIDGRILSKRFAENAPLWIMDADGGNATQLSLPLSMLAAGAVPNQPAITALTQP